MAFVPDSKNPGPWSGWTYGFKDGLQAWLELNYDAGGGIFPESDMYWAKFTVQPSAALKARQNKLVKGLKESALWAKMDYIALLTQQETAQPMGLNLVSPNMAPATVIGNPVLTFGAGGGFKGDGVDDCANTGWNPTTAPTPKYTQNNCHAGVWIGDNVTGNLCDLGNSNSNINSRNTTSVNCQINNTSAAGGVVPGPTSVGHSMFVRNSSVTAEVYKNGVSVATSVIASGALTNAPFMIGARNTATVADRFSTRKCQIAHWGAFLTAAEITVLYGHFNAYVNDP